MKKLEGLKVEALAVAVPTDGYHRSQMVYHIVPQGELQHIITTGTVRVFLPKLPEGEWQILGRADELSHSDCFQLVENNGWGCLLNYGSDATPDNKYTFMDEKASWQSYCMANSLTNELILIKA